MQQGRSLMFATTAVVMVVALLSVLVGPSSAALPTPSGLPVCWGNNAYNMTALPIISPAVWRQLSASEETTCGLGSDQAVHCWGANSWGQQDIVVDSYSWVSSGWDHTCAISGGVTNYTVCWGLNNHNQLGVPAGAVFRNVSCGWWHSCGIQYNGTVRCWGADTGTDKDFGQSVVPTTLPFTQVAAGYHHTCGLLTNNGSILCWGDSSTGVTTPPTGQFIAVGAGEGVSCGLLKSGTALCWGSNTAGVLDVPAGAVFSDLWVGQRYACGMTTSGGGMVCWGSGASQVTPPSNYYNWNGVSAGKDHMCGFGATRTPSPTPSLSPISSRSPTPSVSLTPPMSLSPTPLASRTPTSSPTPTPTPTPSSTPLVPSSSSTRSPSPSPSPSSPVVTFAPISANVTATFGDNAPVVAVAAPVAATSGARTLSLDSHCVIRSRCCC
jgi:hypothetical protein